jgi:hypothetical protein
MREALFGDVFTRSILRGKLRNKRRMSHRRRDIRPCRGRSFGSWRLAADLHQQPRWLGTDRIMFSVDYPFENMDDAADWIETCDIGEDDRSKIAYGNAKRLLKL